MDRGWGAEAPSVGGEIEKAERRGNQSVCRETVVSSILYPLQFGSKFQAHDEIEGERGRERTEGGRKQGRKEGICI